MITTQNAETYLPHQGAAPTVAGPLGSRAVGVAIAVAAAAALFAALGSAYFATGAGTDYPEPEYQVMGD